MAEALAAPPGRAGRLWLRERLAAARRAGDLLDRKVRVLRDQRDRYAAHARTAEDEWVRASRIAAGWSTRAALLGGERELRLSAPAQPAEVEVRWSTVMGLPIPSEVDCRLPGSDPGSRTPGSAAVVEAATTIREAVRAAAAHAIASATVAALDRELGRTRRRLRAITTGLIPRLEAALRTREAQLEEMERAELVRLRRALGPARTG